MYDQPIVTSEASKLSFDIYVSPRDVLDDPNMTVDDKRALLASWASDAHAVADAPALRQLDNSGILQIDDVLDALKRLDQPASDVGARRSRHQNDGGGANSAVLIKLRQYTRRWHRDDDDDDPPPCPVSARRPRPVPLVDGAYAA